MSNKFLIWGYVMKMFPVFTGVDGTDRLLIAIAFIYLLFMVK